MSGATATDREVGAADGWDVFICHKSEYKPWVEWLARTLQRQGRGVFLDIWNLVPGDSWVEGLHRGLDRCRAAILVATPEVVNSGWVREEFNRLQQRRQSGAGFRLVPVVFGELPNLPFLANLQAVDCRDPAKYRFWLHRIVCGLDGREPGPPTALVGEIDAPPAVRPARATDVVPSEERFVQRVAHRIATPECRPLMVVSRGRRPQGPVIAALRQQIASALPGATLLHLTPPFSERTAVAAFFAELCRQCRFDTAVADAPGFIAAIEQRLERGPTVVLFVGGFENANAACRFELAGALRSLTERYSVAFRVVLVGGLRLMEQKFGSGALSLLSDADVEQWPQPVVSDLLAWQSREFAQAGLDASAATDLLAVSGGHAGLARYCLERAEDRQVQNWGDWCLVCPELWETWHGLAREEPSRLRDALDRSSFGLPTVWPTDPTARRLYWADLLREDQGALHWRCEAVLQVGREVLP